MCIVDDTGRIVKEVKVASEPRSSAEVLGNPPTAKDRTEAGPLSQWLFSGLAEAGSGGLCRDAACGQCCRRRSTRPTAMMRGISPDEAGNCPVHVKTLAVRSCNAADPSQTIAVEGHRHRSTRVP